MVVVRTAVAAAVAAASGDVFPRNLWRDCLGGRRRTAGHEVGRRGERDEPDGDDGHIAEGQVDQAMDDRC